MFNQVSAYIANKIDNLSPFKNDEKEIFKYRLEIILMQGFTFAALLFLASKLNLFVNMFMFILFFTILRGFTNGYHSKTSIGCLVQSTLISLLNILLSHNIRVNNYIWIVLIILLTSLIYIVKNAPINSTALDLSKNEIHNLNKRTKQVIMLEMLIIFLLFLLKVDFEVYFSAILAIISVAISMWLAKKIK